MTLRIPLPNRAIAALTVGKVALVANPACAQHLSFDVGPMAGAAIASWRGADTRGGAGSRTSFVGGGFVTIGIGKYFALEPQVLYAQKGTELTGSGVTVTYKQNYVEIPFLITGKYPFAGPMSFAPTIFAGPALAFQTSCRFSSTGTSGPGYQVFPVSDAMCDSLLAAGNAASMRHTDALLVLGGGFNVGRVKLLARYDLGLTRFFVQRPPLRTPLDIKTQAWVVSAGFRLPLGNR
jgi:outer membrane protein with beta-barrel domain